MLKILDKEMIHADLNIMIQQLKHHEITIKDSLDWIQMTLMNQPELSETFKIIMNDHNFWNDQQIVNSIKNQINHYDDLAKIRQLTLEINLSQNWHHFNQTDRCFQDYHQDQITGQTDFIQALQAFNLTF